MVSTTTAVLHGQQLSFVDVGEGPAILFIHGLLGSHQNWVHLIDRLDGAHRVVVPDLFGHGASAKPVGDYSIGAHAATLRDLLDHLGIDKVTVVGHSLGGGVALQMCYLFPERVERLVLVASGGFGRTVSPLLRSVALPGAEWVLPVIASRRLCGSVSSAAKVLSAVGVRASADLTAAWQGFSSLSDAESRRAFLATTRSVIDPGGQTVSARDHLPPARPLPTMVVWGSRDRLIPVGHAEAARTLIPGCRIEVFDGAGHFPHLERPNEFAAVLNDFMRTQRRSRASSRSA